MVNRLRRNAILLRALCGKHWQRLLSIAAEDLLLCLSDCAYNAIKGNLELTKAQHRILSRHRRLLNGIKPKTPIRKIQLRLVTRATPKFMSALIEPSLMLSR